MSRSTKLLTFLTGASATCLLVAVTPPTAAGEVFTVSRAIPLPDAQSLVSFYISDVDPTLGLFSLGHRSNKAGDLIQHNKLTLRGSQAKEDFGGATRSDH